MTDKWRDAWFRRLTPKAKLLWIYLSDICDNAGFLTIDIDLFHSETGLTVKQTTEAWAEVAPGLETNGDTAWLVRFLEVQKCLPLCDTCHPHAKIKERLLQMVNFSPNIQLVLDGKRPIKAGQDTTLPGTLPTRVKEEEGDKDKDKEEDKDKKKYGECQSVLLTDEEYNKLLARHGNDRLATAIEILDTYIASKGAKYASHYAVFKETSWIWGRVDEVKAGKSESGQVNKDYSNLFEPISEFEQRKLRTGK